MSDLGQHLRHVRQHGAEERPPPVQVLQHLQPARPASAIHSSNAVPVPYQPGSITRDWLQASTHGMARRSEIDVGGLARCRPAADVQRADLADRRGRLEVLDETRCLVHQFGVGALGAGGQLVEHLVGGSGGVAQPLDVEQRRFQRGGQQRLQVAVRDPRLGVLGGDHLALLGDPQRPVHRARRLRQDGVVARAAAAADRAAATVEEPQPDSGLAGRLRPGRARRGTAPSWPPGSRRPCWSRSSRASPPGCRRVRPPARGTAEGRAPLRESTRRAAGRRSSRTAARCRPGMYGSRRPEASSRPTSLSRTPPRACPTPTGTSR